MKRGTISRIPKAKIPKLKRKLDQLFSAMIRERDLSLSCISCSSQLGKQAGHFRRRELMSTRWNPKNVNGQCARCNCWLSGNEFAYAEGLDNKYGEGTAKKLYEISKKVKQWEAWQLQALIDAAKEGLEAYERAYKVVTEDIEPVHKSE